MNRNKKYYFILILFSLFSLFWLSSIFFTFPLQAADYVIYSSTTYTIDEDGKTVVEKEIQFTNLTSTFILPQYSLSLNFGNVENITAQDDRGTIKTKVESADGKTTIILNLDQYPLKPKKVTGWKIRFETTDIAQKEGLIWEIIIPHKETSSEEETESTTVRIPLSWGNENYISPKPDKTEEKDGHRIFTYADSKAKTISGTWGQAQAYEVSLKYHLENESAEKQSTEIALPADKPNQQVLIDSILPQPLSVRVDEDGNYLARYELNPKEVKEIIVATRMIVYPKQYRFEEALTENILPAELEIYLKPQKYWEVDDPVIETKIKELNLENKSQTEKAKIIFDFVKNYLAYDQTKTSLKTERFGALKILENPTQAVCIEYTDLLITLLRRAGIPAREIDGFALTSSTSTDMDVLHTWVELYLPSAGWIQVDPTWSSPPSNIDLFSQFDAKHLAFVTKGLNSEYPFPAGSYKTQADEKEDVAVKNTSLPVENTSELEASLNFIPKALVLWTESGELEIKNTTPYTIYNLKSEFECATCVISFQNQILPIIPPLSAVKIPVKVKSNFIWKSNQAVIGTKLSYQTFGEKSIEQNFQQTLNFLSPGKSFLLVLAGFGLAIGCVIVLFIIIEHGDKVKRKIHR